MRMASALIVDPVAGLCQFVHRRTVGGFATANVSNAFVGGLKQFAEVDAITARDSWPNSINEITHAASDSDSRNQLGAEYDPPRRDQDRFARACARALRLPNQGRLARTLAPLMPPLLFAGPPIWPTRKPP
jgi:hypothetical protein